MTARNLDQEMPMLVKDFAEQEVTGLVEARPGTDITEAQQRRFMRELSPEQFSRGLKMARTYLALPPQEREREMQKMERGGAGAALKMFIKKVSEIERAHGEAEGIATRVDALSPQETSRTSSQWQERNMERQLRSLTTEDLPRLKI